MWQVVVKSVNIFEILLEYTRETQDIHWFFHNTSFESEELLLKHGTIFRKFRIIYIYSMKMSFDRQKQ